jgi:TRAP-type C4-dicarboxylate transport system substrate-binding protein
MDAVGKRTAGRITFKPGYAGSLFTITEAFDAVQSGAVELAVTAASVLTGKIPDVGPLEPLGAYPYGGPRYAEMLKEVEPILETLFAQHNVVYLWSYGGPGVTNVCRSKHTKLPDDYRGLKLRPAGRWQAVQMRALGASPVVIDPGSVYQALQTGTIDCALANNNLTLSFKLHEPAKFVVQYGLPVNWVFYLMSKKAFDALPAEDRRILRDTSREASQTGFALVAEAQEASVARLREQGANLHPLTDAERKAFQDASRGVYDEIRKTAGDLGRKLLDITAKYR